MFYPTTSEFWLFLTAKVLWRKTKAVIGGGLKPIFQVSKKKNSRIGSPS